MPSKFFKVFVLFMALCACLPSCPLADDAPPLRIVFEDYPPYEYLENGRTAGVNVVLIREAFRRMGVDVVFESRPWKRALYDLRHGDILALSSGFKTAEREAFAYFPSQPLAMETNVVAVLDSSDLTVAALEDLRGLRVGVVRDYVYGEPFDSMIGLNKVMAQSSQMMVRMLLEKRMDVVVGNRAVLRHIARDAGVLDHIRFIFEVGSDPLYLFFSRARGRQAQYLAEAFGKAIEAMRADGTFDDILSRY